MFGFTRRSKLKPIKREFSDIESRNTCSAFRRVRSVFEKNLQMSPDAFIEASSSAHHSPRQVAMTEVANISGDFLESGQLCAYRGLLSPEGEEMIDIFMYALNELVELGSITSIERDSQISAVRQSVQNVG